jgi:hypothetical protein
MSESDGADGASLGDAQPGNLPPLPTCLAWPWLGQLFSETDISQYCLAVAHIWAPAWAAMALGQFLAAPAKALTASYHCPPIQVL